MEARFQHWGYPTSCISSAYQRALHRDKESLLVKKTRVNNISLQITFSTQYSPMAGRVKNIVLKGVVYDSGESMLIFELNSQTNTPLPSVLLQTRASNAQNG